MIFTVTLRAAARKECEHSFLMWKITEQWLNLSVAESMKAVSEVTVSSVGEHSCVRVPQGPYFFSRNSPLTLAVFFHLFHSCLNIQVVFIRHASVSLVMTGSLLSGAANIKYRSDTSPKTNIGFYLTFLI